MGFYRGVSDAGYDRPKIEKAAAEMRAKYLTHGKGCKTRAKVIAARTHGPETHA